MRELLNKRVLTPVESRRKQRPRLQTIHKKVAQRKTASNKNLIENSLVCLYVARLYYAVPYMYNCREAGHIVQTQMRLCSYARNAKTAESWEGKVVQGKKSTSSSVSLTAYLSMVSVDGFRKRKR